MAVEAWHDTVCTDFHDWRQRRSSRGQALTCMWVRHVSEMVKIHSLSAFYLTFYSLAVTVCTASFNFSKFYILLTLDLWVLFVFQKQTANFVLYNNHRLILWARWKVLTARYEHGLCKQNALYTISSLKELSKVRHLSRFMARITDWGVVGTQNVRNWERHTTSSFTGYKPLRLTWLCWRNHEQWHYQEA